MGICNDEPGKTISIREVKLSHNEIEIGKILQMGICKIKCNNVNSGYGVGFLCKIPFPNKSNLLPVLITNYHILEKDDIVSRKNIKLFFKDDYSINIKIDNSRIYYSKDIYNITIIELKDKEITESFSEIDDDIPSKHITNIVILNYGKDYQKHYSFGEINDLNKENFSFIQKYSNQNTTENYLLGAPILNKSNYKVLGIYIGKDEKYNKGILIKNPIIDFYNYYKNRKQESIDKKEENDKIKSKKIKEKNKNENRYVNEINNNINKNREKESENNSNILKMSTKIIKQTNNIIINKENNYLNKRGNEEIKNEKSSNKSNNSKNLNKNINKNIDSCIDNKFLEKNKSPKSEINNKNQDKINNIYNKEKDKEINLIFLIINKELNLDVKENIIFKEVIKKLFSKFLWLKYINKIDFRFNGKVIDKNKTVKENGLKDNSNIELLYEKE